MGLLKTEQQQRELLAWASQVRTDARRIYKELRGDQDTFIQNDAKLLATLGRIEMDCKTLSELAG